MAITQFEQEVLLCHILKIERAKLFSHPERKLTPAEQGLFDDLVSRRENHEPLAYLVNNQPFMGLNFYVDQNVLIPRPETELLVETVIQNYQATKLPSYQATIADIGTGCGCIAISLAKYLPNAKVIAIDSSAAALAIAKQNAKANDANIDFRLGHLFEPLNEKVDLIVSNPPYIPTAEIDKLDPDVKDFEPRAALDGGEDGLKYIRELISKAPSHLTTQLPTRLFIEIGYDQANKLKELGNFKFIKDYNGYDRILVC